MGLVSGLVVLVALAIGFTIAAVQLQAAAAAYLGGQSVWSRAQIASVHYLDRYGRTGSPEALEQARSWLTVPLSDLEARKAMEREPLDYEKAREGMIRGRNHPDDVARMIWLFRHFSDVGHLHRAVEVWRESDQTILALERIAHNLETEWGRPSPEPERLSALREELGDVNSRAEPLTRRFRESMTEAARWMTRILSITSIAFLAVIALAAWLMGWGLVRLLRGSEEKFRAIFEQAAVGMAQVSESGRILDANTALCDLMAYPRETLLGLRYRDLVHPDDWASGREQARDVMTGELSNYTLEQRLLSGSGVAVWARLTVSRMTHKSRGAPDFIVIMEDVSESHRLSVELTHQATHDALTGLFNRRAFERRLSESLARARAEQSHHVLCFIDLDQFKLINDTSGHAAGDRVLCQVVDIFEEILRDGDMLARLGGDEFGIVLENCELDTATHIVERLRRALEETAFVWDERRYNISCSVGLVPITARSQDVESLHRAADIACYMAKEQGRNRLYVSREDDQQLVEQRGQMEWLNRIRDALQDDRLFLDAQLIVPSGHNGELRYEVLVRLRNEEGEVVPPGTFLPAAERFGAAHQIDRWVIERVLSQLAAHPEHLDKLESCHINLSGRSFDQPDFQSFVIDAFDRHRVPARKICFEITETAAVNNLAEAIEFMTRLGKRGCRFALDDFGTGLSSFSYLRRLPVDYLKIDGIFVRDMATDNTDLAMVRAINDIGQTLNKKTIAEFVENDETTRMLADMGVDYCQGFGLHRPCRFETLLCERAEGPASKPPR